MSSTPLCFYLEKGENKIQIENVSSGGLTLGKLEVSQAKTEIKDYNEYADEHKDAELVTDDKDALQIDAIYYTEKNSTDATYGTETKTSLTRFNIDKKIK